MKFLKYCLVKLKNQLHSQLQQKTIKIVCYQLRITKLFLSTTYVYKSIEFIKV